MHHIVQDLERIVFQTVRTRRCHRLALLRCEHVRRPRTCVACMVISVSAATSSNCFWSKLTLVRHQVGSLESTAHICAHSSDPFSAVEDWVSTNLKRIRSLNLASIRTTQRPNCQVPPHFAVWGRHTTRRHPRPRRSPCPLHLQPQFAQLRSCSHLSSTVGNLRFHGGHIQYMAPHRLVTRPLSFFRWQMHVQRHRLIKHPRAFWKPYSQSFEPGPQNQPGLRVCVAKRNT